MIFSQQLRLKLSYSLLFERDDDLARLQTHAWIYNKGAFGDRFLTQLSETYYIILSLSIFMNKFRTYPQCHIWAMCGSRNIFFYDNTSVNSSLETSIYFHWRLYFLLKTDHCKVNCIPTEKSSQVDAAGELKRIKHGSAELEALCFVHTFFHNILYPSELKRKWGQLVLVCTSLLKTGRTDSSYIIIIEMKSSNMVAIEDHVFQWETQ